MLVKLKNVTLVHFNNSIFSPSKFQGQGDAYYNAQFIFEKDSESHKNLMEAVKAVASEAYKAKASRVLKDITPNKMKFPIREGDSFRRKEDDSIFEGYEGNLVLIAKLKEDRGSPVVLFGGSTGRDPITDVNKSKMYSGVVVNAAVEIWAPKNDEAIRAELRVIQYVSKGVRMGGSSGEANAVDLMDDITVEEDDLINLF